MQKGKGNRDSVDAKIFLKQVQKQYSTRSKHGGSGTIFGISAAPSYLNIYNYPVLNFNNKISQ